jgi:hypothetical protein
MKQYSQYFNIPERWKNNKAVCTFILKALLKPLAKNPPNGAIIDANKPRAKACHCTGKRKTSFHGNCQEKSTD